MKDIISVIGLGYVGLPLCLELSKYNKVIGYDKNKKRVKELKNNYDINDQFKANLKKNNIYYTDTEKDLKDSNIYIITVPTPINHKNLPDLTHLRNACEMIGKYLFKGNIVVFESTVYPGCTEGFCVPILEKKSGLKFNKDFFCGYSPERINVGDSRYQITKIKKIISASDRKTLQKLKYIYSKIVKAGLFKTSSIKVAEAAKLIENVQRDLNIAFVNELSIIFSKLNLDTHEVLNAASTKWNFHKYFPGLVGGHCISVDPYYLTFLANKFNYNPKIILAGRDINENMSKFIVKRIEKHTKKFLPNKKKYNLLILGFTFKENCRDIRNTKVYNIYQNLNKKKFNIDIHDPRVEESDIKKNYNLKLIKKLPKNKYDYCLIAVRHKEFRKIKKRKFDYICKKKYFVFDLKGCLKIKPNNYERL